jgi:hypothetical protein
LKPFNRFDNYKTHIEAHADPSRNGRGRVMFVPAAVARYKELLEGTKQRKPKSRSPDGVDFKRHTSAMPPRRRPTKRDTLDSWGTPTSSFDDSKFFSSRNSSMEPGSTPFQMWGDGNVKVEQHNC